MRREEFKMERLGLLAVGDELPVKEYELPNSYYYMLGSAFAMSKNYTTLERIRSKSGKVVDIKDTPRGYYVTVEFSEEGVEL